MRTDILDIFRSTATVFTFKEILLASSEPKPNLLKRRLNYYVQKGDLLSLRRGFYTKDNNYNRFEFATKLYTPSYVSFETVLAEAGIIFQHYNKIFVATYQTKEIECDKQLYDFKKIKDTILTNSAGIENRGTYCIATKERAFLDILYLNRKYYFDNLSPLDESKVQELLPIYQNQSMEKRVQRTLKASKGL